MTSVTLQPGLSIERRNAVIVIDWVIATAAIGIESDIADKLQRHLADWGRDAELYAVVMRFRTIIGVKEPPEQAVQAYQALLSTIWHLECFSKPTVSLLEGTITPKVAALARAGTHVAASADTIWDLAAGRGATQNLSGLSWWLSQLDPRVAATLLAGSGKITVPDAVAFGFATHAIAATEFDAIISGLADADPVDPLLDDRVPSFAAAGTKSASLPDASIALPADMERRLAAARSGNLRQALLIEAGGASHGTNASGDFTLPSRAALQSLRR